jgi:hypothetical protein
MRKLSCSFLVVRAGEVRPHLAGLHRIDPNLERVLVLSLARKCWQPRKSLRREAESGCMAWSRIKVFCDRIGRSASG